MVLLTYCESTTIPVGEYLDITAASPRSPSSFHLDASKNIRIVSLKKWKKLEKRQEHSDIKYQTVLTNLSLDSMFKPLFMI